jgi:hypothetical protein
MEQSSVNVPQVQPPRREGLSRRGILMIVVLVAIFYVANWISTKPLTRHPNLKPTPTAYRPAPALSGAPAEDAPDGRWCVDFGGVFERFSNYVEICYFLPFQNSNSSSYNKRR